MSENNEMLNAVNTMLGNIELFQKQAELNACLTKVTYDTLTSAGFTKQQAMELIKARGPLLA